LIDTLNPWLIAALVFALTHWLARWKGMSRLAAATKMPVTIALILWSLSDGDWSGGKIWIGAGLCFSLVGDVLLLLPRRFFLAGLVSFLLAHTGYIAGFILPFPVVHPILFALSALIGTGIYFYLQNLNQALQTRKQGKRLFQAIILYSLVLCLMTLAACQTMLRTDWPPAASLFAASGGILFLLSDGLLGYNRFVHALPGGRTFEMMTYHLALTCIVAAAIIRW
jgi:uncharacterized membrane protein YhhN